LDTADVFERYQMSVKLATKYYCLYLLVINRLLTGNAIWGHLEHFEQRVTLYLGKLISPSSALINHATKSIHANVIL